MAKKVSKKKSEAKYEKRFKFAFNRIMELSAATKRKPAYIKIAIDDELAQKLMKDSCSSDFENLEIRGFGLSWTEKVNE